MKLRLNLTIGEKYVPAMSITDQAKADEYFAACVEHNMALGENDQVKAEQIERANLGYFAGYYDQETRARVERLFKCAHPVFGSIAENGPPTQEQAFKAGVDMGMRAAKPD